MKSPPKTVTIKANNLLEYDKLGSIKGLKKNQLIKHPLMIAPRLNINIGHVLCSLLSLIY